MKLWRWLRRAFRRKSVPQIQIEFTEVEYEELKATAEGRGVELEAWAHHRVVAQLPSRLLPPGSAGEQAAFEVLERSDPAPVIVVPPRAPVVSVLPPHPCLHLDPQHPSNFRGQDAQGTCRAPQQHGRPCFWNAVSSRSCPVFELRFVGR